MIAAYVRWQAGSFGNFLILPSWAVSYRRTSSQYITSPNTYRSAVAKFIFMQLLQPFKMHCLTGQTALSARTYETWGNFTANGMKNSVICLCRPGIPSNVIQYYRKRQ